jgi:transcriptional regulator with XRE-family HTH domain
MDVIDIPPQRGSCDQHNPEYAVRSDDAPIANIAPPSRLAKFLLLLSKCGLCSPISLSRIVGTSHSVGGNGQMIIGERLRVLREQKKFSQGDIEKKTGLLRCYVSRVENGHTVPTVETLEKFARALEVPMYQLFYDGEELPELPNLLKRKTADDILWGNSGKDAHLLFKFRRLFGHMEDGDRNMLFYVAQKMANRKPV